MKKKSIDKLYQEKLQDYGQIPDEHVWESIASSLDGKKKGDEYSLFGGN